MTHRDRWAELADREAIGESLTEDEAAFLRDHAASDALAAAETELWALMGAWPERATDLAGDRALAERAVRVASGAATSGGKVVRWVALAALAAAAGVTVYVAARRAPEPVAAAAATLELVESGARIDGVEAHKGARAGVGSEVEAVGGAVCVALEPGMHACLPQGARAKLTGLGGAERRIDLLSGRVAVALNKLPSGERFSVVGGETTSTAVGTAFTVELRQATTETIVHEGVVQVTHGASAGAVTAHRIGLVKADAVEVVSLRDHGATQTDDWLALATVAGRSIETPFDESTASASRAAEPGAGPSSATSGVAGAAPATPESDAVAAAPARPASRPEAPFVGHQRGAAVAGEAPAAPTETVASLLAAARQALREQRWADAASAYRALTARFPGSAEGRTAVVSLAKLELDRTNEPRSALDHLDAYLRSGGPLAMEAELTRVRALRALGRTADEARAIDAFLGRYPSSLDGAMLRTRRAELGAP